MESQEKAIDMAPNDAQKWNRMTCPNRLKQESRLTDSEGYNVGGLGFKKILAVKLYDQKEEHKGT